MDAFFYIDKPSWMTSFDVLRDMRRTLWIKKIGHTGTLDPLATGGLLVATGNYTKLISYVEKDSKTYIATIMLNGSSASLDRDTEINYISDAEQHKFQNKITTALIEKTLSENFSWTITQIPPKYSALKINGKRALDRTLAGEEIEMKARQATILYTKILSFEYPKLELEVSVTAWTYIRTLASDLGEFLGTWWYIAELRRLTVGHLTHNLLQDLSSVSFDDTLSVLKVFPDRIYPIEDEIVLKRLQDGQRVRGVFEFPSDTEIFLEKNGEIRYVVEYIDGVLHPRKKVS